MSSAEEPLHVVIRLPYKRPPGFVEPPSIAVFREISLDERREESGGLFELVNHEVLISLCRPFMELILFATGNLASRLLNVPIPYLLRHAAFLYETQLRGVQAQLRRGEVLSASNSSNNLTALGTTTTRTRASSRASSNKIPAMENNEPLTRTRASSRASLNKVTVDPNDPITRPRASSRASLTKGSIFDLKEVPATRSRSPSIREQAPINYRGSPAANQDTLKMGEPAFVYQGRNDTFGSEARSSPISHTSPSPQTNSPSFARRSVSNASSVSTITPIDQITSNLRPLINAQGSFVSTLSTIESESATTPSPDDNEADEDYQESKSTIFENNLATSFTDKLKRLQGVAAFLPLVRNNSSSGSGGSTATTNSTDKKGQSSTTTTNINIDTQHQNIRDPTIINTTNVTTTPPRTDDANNNSTVGKSPLTPAPESTSNSTGSSFSELSDSSVTRSALEDAIMSSNLGVSKMSMFSRKSSYFPGS
ncbi:9856_t:CDS:2 [Ambispora leptoticha]|uniref:9856_t:CDS:1 n=1 Tax=Ambispora leptoticha TaxID=144679 RepID=A0A9N9AR77_9GLOM|nr:9856_t:CDS:2 [Ambispora leptoticha]